ncbi:juvenile hormone epoxide hydrolase 1 [Trichonephila clavipes]|nr:juvenile hormone epoxide hydrolase 1 [Trichonephila clavipes]
MIPFLTTPNPEQDFVFEVICPSIPGYGFSSSPCKKGFDARAASRLFLTLMERLGHNHFYVQGGDWGSLIVTILGKYYPSRIIGVHVNMYSSGPKSWDIFKAMAVAYFPSLVSPAEYKGLFPFWERFKTILQESGYFHIQATKPDTVGKFPFKIFNSCRKLHGCGILVVKVTDLWPVCHVFEPTTTEDLLCRGEMHVKSVESPNILPLVYQSSGIVLLT